jgi:hypothetical protein
MEQDERPKITREHVGVAMMAVGYASLVGGIAAISMPVAAIVGGALLLIAGVAIDRMS